MDSSILDDSEMVDAYLKHFATRDDSLFWVVQAIDELARVDLERAWALTLSLIDKAPDAEFLAYVAAGPLEDLLNNFGSGIIDRVELHARRNPKFRLALSGVWGTFPGQGNTSERIRRAVGVGSNYNWDDIAK
jgi:hypothetical protein